MRLWGIPGEPEPVPPGSDFEPAAPREFAPPCVHAGDEIAGPERDALGLSHARVWFRCNLGHGNGGAVCTCHPHPLGCKGCPDYRPDDGR